MQGYVFQPFAVSMSIFVELLSECLANVGINLMTEPLHLTEFNSTSLEYVGAFRLRYLYGRIVTRIQGALNACTSDWIVLFLAAPISFAVEFFFEFSADVSFIAMMGILHFIVCTLASLEYVGIRPRHFLERTVARVQKALVACNLQWIEQCLAVLMILPLEFFTEFSTDGSINVMIWPLRFFAHNFASFEFVDTTWFQHSRGKTFALVQRAVKAGASLSKAQTIHDCQTLSCLFAVLISHFFELELFAVVEFVAMSGLFHFFAINCAVSLRIFHEVFYELVGATRLLCYSGFQSEETVVQVGRAVDESLKGCYVPELRGGSSSRKRKNKAMRERKQNRLQGQSIPPNHNLRSPDLEEVDGQISDRDGAAHDSSWNSCDEGEEDYEDVVSNSELGFDPDESTELELLQLLEPSWDLDDDSDDDAVTYYNAPDGFWVSWDLFQGEGHHNNFDDFEEACQIISSQAEKDSKLFDDEKSFKFMKFEKCTELTKFENCSFGATVETKNGDEHDDGFEEEILRFLAAIEDDCSTESFEVTSGVLRGGAGGSHATRKKREISRLIEDLEEWYEEVEDDDMKRLLMKIAEIVQTWKNKGEKKQSEKPKEDVKSGQSFYTRFNEKVTGNQEHPKAKGKGKGKTKNDGMPRFDLGRQFPRAEVTSWQHALHQLEQGAPPRGEVCICSDVPQMIEMQQMAKALSINKKMTLIAKANNASDPKPAAYKEMMLPILGNLALLQSCVCCLSGDEPTMKGTIPKEVKIRNEEFDVLRVLIPMKFIDKKHHDTLYGRPEYSLKLCQWDVETKTHHWESAHGCISGLANLPKDRSQKLLQQSGKGGVFWSKLAQNTTTRPDVTWIQPEENEPDLQYFARVQKLADAAGVPMAFRKGGGADLGMQKHNDEEIYRSFAIWGAPGHFGPEAISELLSAEGWEMSGKPTAPRSAKGPWRAQGKPPDNQLEWGYKYITAGKTKHINVVPWKSVRRLEGESEHIARTRWYSKDDDFEIQATVIDSQTQSQASQKTTMEVDDEEPRNNKRKDSENVPLPKKSARKKNAVIKGGMEGPLQTRVLNLGGAGDCAWRALAFLIAQTNAKWGKDESEIADRAESLGAALRAQAVTYLTVKDKSWEESYCEDSKWTAVTEGGEPAKDLEDFRNNVLGRPNRYICHLGLQAVASVKKINILIWELLDDNQWSKATKAYPKALADIENLGGIYASHGLESDVIENSQKNLDMHVFRAAGDQVCNAWPLRLSFLAVTLWSLIGCFLDEFFTFAAYMTSAWFINGIGDALTYMWVPSTCSVFLAVLLCAIFAASLCAICRSPNGATVKQTADPEITCGDEGPLRTKIRNVGGVGNCAWRALAFLIAQTNTEWQIQESKLIGKLDDLGEKLRAQAMIYLRNDRSWEDSFCVDDGWTMETEGGVPATDLSESRNCVLLRPCRHICHLGFQAVANLKKINIVIWKFDANQHWVKLALFAPQDQSELAPTIHLALGNNHYFVCAKTNERYPSLLAEVGDLRDVFVSTDFQGHFCGNNHGKFDLATLRAAGDNFSTPKRKRSQSVDSLLRSCRSDSSKKSLLRTCSSLQSLKQCDGRKFRPFNWINNQLQGDKWKCSFCEFEIKVKTRNDRVTLIRHLSDNHPKEREAQQSSLRNDRNETRTKRNEMINKKAAEEEQSRKKLGHFPLRIQMNFKRGRTGYFGVICKKCLMTPKSRWPEKGNWPAECDGIPQETMRGEARPGSHWWSRATDLCGDVQKLAIPNRWKQRILAEVNNPTSFQFEEVDPKKADLVCPYCKLGIKSYKKASCNAQQVKLDHLKHCQHAPADANGATWHREWRKLSGTDHVWHKLWCKRNTIGRIKKGGPEKYQHDPKVISIFKPKRRKVLVVCKKCLIARVDKHKWRHTCKGKVAFNAKGQIMPGPFWWSQLDWDDATEVLEIGAKHKKQIQAEVKAWKDQAKKSE
eukprot:s1264_g3.t1